MNLKFWQRQPVRVKILPREITKLSLTEFRQDDRLVNGAKAALNNEYMQLMIQVLKNEHIGSSVLHPAATLEMRMAHQCKCEGYTMALANLEAMAKGDTVSEMPESTYEAEEPTN